MYPRHRTWGVKVQNKSVKKPAVTTLCLLLRTNCNKQTRHIELVVWPAGLIWLCSSVRCRDLVCCRWSDQLRVAWVILVFEFIGWCFHPLIFLFSFEWFLGFSYVAPVSFYLRYIFSGQLIRSWSVLSVDRCLCPRSPSLLWLYANDVSGMKRWRSRVLPL